MLRQPFLYGYWGCVRAGGKPAGAEAAGRGGGDL